jgi:hypothetical protein
MSLTTKFLDYRGPVNLPGIESLLKKLKKTKEFMALDKTTGKRLYAIVVECLENIYEYSFFIPMDDPDLQPHISIRNENDKIIITSGNVVTDYAKARLISRLDLINQLDEAALQTLYENKIDHKPIDDEKSAGLGFISMARKSGNRISYSFNPVNKGYSYFETQISLNKYIMRKLIIDHTLSSPKVILDAENKIFKISGESRPSDAREFYDQILSWLDDFSLYLTRSGEKESLIEFNFALAYFNSSSGKLILDICKVLATLRLKGINIKVNWHFEKDDVDMHEVGKEISKIVKFPFEYIESEIK